MELKIKVNHHTRSLKVVFKEDTQHHFHIYVHKSVHTHTHMIHICIHQKLKLR